MPVARGVWCKIGRRGDGGDARVRDVEEEAAEAEFWIKFKGFVFKTMVLAHAFWFGDR